KIVLLGIGFYLMFMVNIIDSVVNVISMGDFNTMSIIIYIYIYIYIYMKVLCFFFPLGLKM
ncbi:MAG: hypothetical protein MCS20_02250, partial [Candidatus Phytoplasma mali]|nr:hypothetical protein [Candidatus Phytoplasma mali]MCZ8633048.1 hypothetical protein [Spiroplasma sp. Tabriz.8]